MDTAYILYGLLGFVMMGIWYVVSKVVSKDLDIALPGLVKATIKAIVRWRTKGMPSAGRRRWYRRLLADILREKYITGQILLAVCFKYEEPLEDVPDLRGALEPLDEPVDERKQE